MIIDLRSDTVTKPSEGMRKAMYNAEVGDDVFREDPTVNTLEEYTAGILGKEAALFVTSGVMGNQISLNLLSEPGDEVLCERYSHIFNYESGSPAAISGVQLTSIEGNHGVINPEEIEKCIRPPAAYYMPRTKIIAIENTHNMAGGIIQPIENIVALKKITEKYSLKYYLDGARLWNASVETGISVKEYASHFELISCCFSKGLGAPVGSVIAGSKENINKAIRIRKAWGGGMRQAGILAAACLYALKNNFDRLKEDHHKAKMIAESISNISTLEINPDLVQTNIVVFKSIHLSVNEAIAECRNEGLLLTAGSPGYLRAVTHLDISFDNIKRAIEIIKKVFK
jgi:threonine aldolase